MKILITGAKGFIGSELRQLFIHDSKYSTIGTSRSAHTGNNKHSKHSLVNVGEINTETDWSQALDGVSTVIHCAARAHILKEKEPFPMAKFKETNVLGTKKLIQDSINAGVKNFIFISSIGVNGNYTKVNAPFSEDDEPTPVGDYALSKYEAEKEIISLCSNSEMNYVIIRPPLVYGSNAPGNFNSLLRLVEKNYPLPFGAIENKRSMVYVKNLVSFIKTCIENSNSHNELFLISDNYDLSTKELFVHLASSMNKKPKLIKFPVVFVKMLFVMLGQQKKYDKLFGNLTIDMRKAQDKLNWVPAYSTAEALEITASEFIKNRLSNHVA